MIPYGWKSASFLFGFLIDLDFISVLKKHKKRTWQPIFSDLELALGQYCVDIADSIKTALGIGNWALHGNLLFGGHS